MAMSEKVTVQSYTADDFYRDIKYYDNKITMLEKKIKLLVRILVDKNLIGEQLAKTFEETTPDNKELINWYMNCLKGEEQ